MIEKALDRYHFHNPDVELIRHNENMTYRITDNGKQYVLRIHMPAEGFNVDILRAGKDKASMIADEMVLLQHLAKKGDMKTQKVILNVCGKPVTMLDNETPVTVLEWIEGTTLENIGITADISYKIGVMIGSLHNSLARCETAQRYRYDSALVSRMIDEVSLASAQGQFSSQHTHIIIGALSHIRDYLFKTNSMFVTVHADLGKSNLVYHDGAIIPIDFSLSGYCIPEMDLASAFAHINDDTLNQEVLHGYRSICEFETNSYGIEVCFGLQILLFIVTQHDKFASEAWFHKKLNDWCEQYFIPLHAKRP